MIISIALALLIAISLTQAHGGHEQQPIPANADWATRHMSEEHHIASFDAGSFFNLHDYDNSNEWSVEDVMKTYGFRDESTHHVSPDEKEKAAKQVIDLFDRDKSGTISFSEYITGVAQGLKLPDFGYGPGHHGDDEYEYEVHHFEKFHDENTKEEDLTHPEDVEHYRKHDQLEAQKERQEQMDKMSIIEGNIPVKFRRNG